MSNLHLATQYDIPDVLNLINKFQEESSYNTLPFSRDIAFENLIKIIESPDGLVLLLKKDGKTIGMLIAMAVTMMFSDTKISSELAWYIEPEHRSSKDGFILLEAYEYWSKKVGCKLCQMVCLESLAPEKLSKLYERKGYKRFEMAFVKENF